MGLAAPLACCAALLLTLAGCRNDPLGKPCAADEQCGPGYDCFRNVCFQVCTKDGECRTGQVCHRYHCLESGEETARATPLPASKSSSRSSGRSLDRPLGTVPPVPDATAAELRAMRHELGVLRRDVAKLLAAQGLRSSGGKPMPGEASDHSPAPTPRPKKSVITLPPAAPTQP